MAMSWVVEVREGILSACSISSTRKIKRVRESQGKVGNWGSCGCALREMVSCDSSEVEESMKS